MALATVPYPDGAREAATAGYISGGTRNRDCVAATHPVGQRRRDWPVAVSDAQTSGGLLVAGEVPGATVIGELTSAAEYSVIVD